MAPTDEDACDVESISQEVEELQLPVTGPAPEVAN